MTRSEHLAWCKKRAHEYADTGEYANAITSMMSDMEKHAETAFNGSPTGTALMMAAARATLELPPAVESPYSAKPVANATATPAEGSDDAQP